MFPIDDDHGRSGGTPAVNAAPAQIARSVDAAVAEIAAAQHGVVSLAQLRACGLGARAVQHRAARGRLHRIHRGVYAVGHAALAPDGRRMAAVLACGPGAVLSHRTAAVLWGLRRADGGRYDVTVARNVRGPAAVRVHRVRGLAAADVAIVDGIPRTSVARTLLDLAGVLRRDDLERAVHEAAVLRLDLRGLRLALDAARGRRGAAVLRDILAEPSAGVTRGALEERFLALCRRHSLPRPRLNARVETHAGTFEVDALWPAPALVVELDGAAVHRTRRAFHTDRRRDAALAAVGHVVVRLTWERVTREGDAVADELRRVLAVRGVQDRRRGASPM